MPRKITQGVPHSKHDSKLEFLGFESIPKQASRSCWPCGLSARSPGNHPSSSLRLIVVDVTVDLNDQQEGRRWQSGSKLESKARKRAHSSRARQCARQQLRVVMVPRPLRACQCTVHARRERMLLRSTGNGHFTEAGPLPVIMTSRLHCEPGTGRLVTQAVGASP